MKASLVIRNVGPIKEISLSVKEIMILIGPQSTGKSITAKIIYILKNIKFLSGKVQFDKFISDYGLKDFFSEQSYIRYDSENYVFEFTNNEPILTYKSLQFDDLISKRLANWTSENYHKSKDEFNKLMDETKKEIEDIRNGITQDSDKITLEKVNELEEKVNKMTTLKNSISDFESESRDLLENVKNFSTFSKYIPAERNIISVFKSSAISLFKNNIPFPNSLLNFGELYENAKSKITDYQIPFLSNYRYLNEGGEEFIQINDSDIKIKLVDSSSGLQSLMPLLMCIEFISESEKSVNNCFVIEEPEQNLFPKTQYDLIKYISRKFEAKNTDIVITTHSPYILSSTNTLLMSFKVNAKKKNPVSEKVGIIDPSLFNAYYFDNGICENIFDEETGLISSNMLDNVSYEILEDFKELLKLNVNAKTN